MSKTDVGIGETTLQSMEGVAKEYLHDNPDDAQAKIILSLVGKVRALKSERNSAIARGQMHKKGKTMARWAAKVAVREANEFKKQRDVVTMECNAARTAIYLLGKEPFPTEQIISAVERYRLHTLDQVQLDDKGEPHLPECSWPNGRCSCAVDEQNMPNV